MHKKYLRYYLLFILILAIPAVHSVLFLYKIGELRTPHEIAQIQNGHPYCIYGSALRDNALNYKIEMYKLKHPDILALGSSRILQFRESFFNKSFYNMGYTIASVSDADQVTDIVLQEHKPGLIIMNIDFWWFHPSHKFEGVKKSLSNPQQTMQAEDVLAPFKWLLKSKISSKDFFELPYKMNNKQCGIGAKGYERNAGFAPDGSYYYTDVISGSPYVDRTGMQADYHFKEIAERIDKGVRSFEYGSTADPALINNFLKVLQKLKAEGVDIVLFFPSLAPETIKLMKAHDYTYIEDLKAKLRENHVEFYDYTDYAFTHSSNCEFIDGFHGGDLIDAKILLNMANQPRSKLKDLVNIKYLNEVVGNYKGISMIPNTNITLKSEYDFLGLGCIK